MELNLLSAASWGEWLIQPSNWLVILQVAGGLGFVIFVHELGHFLVAKACGVKCEKFFLGFDVGGLKILSFTWGETEYGIGALPLGGYVKMLGQDDNPSATTAEALRARPTGDLPAEPTSDSHQPWDPRSYPAQSVPKRMAIISAGVIMNLIFAVIMASWAYRLGIKELTCEVSSVRPGGAAWRAGMRTGDEITSIGQKKSPIFSDLQRGVTLGNVTNGVEFTFHRPLDDSIHTVMLQPDTDLGVPTVGVTSPFSTTLPQSGDGDLPMSATSAEPPLQKGDTIIAVGETPVKTYAELLAELSRSSSDFVEMKVERGGTVGPITVKVPPQKYRTIGMEMTPLPIKAVQGDSPAGMAGILPGDSIVGIDIGETGSMQGIGDPLSLAERLQAAHGKQVVLKIMRNLENGKDPSLPAAAVESISNETSSQTKSEFEVTLVPRNATWLEESRWPSSPVSIPSIGVAIPVDGLVAAVESGGPADKAGVVPGDRVTNAAAFDSQKKDAEEIGMKISKESPSWPFVVSAIQLARPGVRLRLVLMGADGTERIVELDPVDSTDRWIVDRGLVFEPVYTLKQAESIPAALSLGARKTLDDVSLVYTFLQKLTSRQISPRLLGGPIEIAKQAGRSAEEGFSRLLLFLTMLSANLAVVNFLPIPVLDGGHMVFLSYEFIRGKPPSENVVIVLSYVGLALLLSLMLFVFGLDLGLIPRR
ncbi:MAG: site-2 protease family protein [Planctomycetia bacterium]|nr:site-2 protease family protein [Planctomycetia bacterium]